jgi:hypothetical protein
MTSIKTILKKLLTSNERQIFKMIVVSAIME